MRLSDMKVGGRLALAFGLVLLMNALISAMGIARLDSLTETTRQLATQEHEKSRATLEWRQTIELNWVRTRAALLEADDERIKAWQAEMDSSSKRVAELQSRMKELLKEPAAREILAEIDHQRALYRDAREGLMKRKLSGQDFQVDLGAMLQPKADSYVKSLAALEALQQQLHEEAVAQALDGAARSRMIVLIASAVMLLFVAGLAFVLARSVTRPLRRAVDAARAIAAGDLAQDIASEGRDEAAEMLLALRDMQSSLANIVGGVREGTHTIATASSQIASGNQDLSSRTEEQASSLEQTAAAMEQLTGAVKQNADNARQANQLAVTASESARRGGEAAGLVVDTMEAINLSSRKIVDIISVIDGIAFQTNILALNAAVEAARAGEQGRGFAVVAAEVRNLAQRSAAAAKEIKSLIDDSVAKVGEGSEQVSRAGATMNEIVEGVKRVTDIMAEISAASQEQTTGIEQVSQAISQMDQVTQQNAALVEEAAAAAQSMQQQAGALTVAVSAFKLDRSHGVKPVPTLPQHTKPLVTRKVIPNAKPAPVRRLAASPKPGAARKLAPAPRLAVAGPDDWTEF